MHKHPIITVTKFEIVRQLKKPSFWIALLLIPLLLLGIMGLSFISGYNAEDVMDNMASGQTENIAITDRANLIKDQSNVKVFDDKDQGIAAVKSGDIDIYYYIPETFLQNPKIELYAKAENGAVFSNYEPPLRQLLTASVMEHVAPEDIIVITNGYTFTSTTFDESGEEVNLLGQAIIPIAVLSIFYILICVFGNRLLMTVVEEKENRISEMILTAVSARHLIIGKLIALILLGFLQILVFVLPMLIALIIYRDNPSVVFILDSIQVNPFIIITNIILLLSSYFLFAGLCTLVGAIVPTAREASQYIGVVMVPLVFPLFFITNFFSDKPDFLVYALSYFPLSAPIALMLRNAFGILPWYEMLLGLLELTICSIIVLTLTVKTFQKNAISFSLTKFNFSPRKSWKKR